MAGLQRGELTAFDFLAMVVLRPVAVEWKRRLHRAGVAGRYIGSFGDHSVHRGFSDRTLSCDDGIHDMKELAVYVDAVEIAGFVVAEPEPAGDPAVLVHRPGAATVAAVGPPWCALM